MNTKETEHYPILAQCLGGVIQQVKWYEKYVNYGWEKEENMPAAALANTVAVFHITKIKKNVSTNL